MGFLSSAPPTHLPPAEGVRLDGAPAAFPADFGPATLVVVTFRDDAAPLSGQWARLGARLAEATPGLAVVEMLVYPPRLRLLGEIALLSQKARAEAAGAASRTAVVYTKRKAFRKALQIRSESDVTAFLVGPDGAIAWRGAGEIDLHAAGALEQAVHVMLVPTSAGPDAQ